MKRKSPTEGAPGHAELQRMCENAAMVARACGRLGMLDEELPFSTGSELDLDEPPRDGAWLLPDED